MTCGVWAGFDKRRTIYRGAFSNEIALPIWADVMKATFSDYRPREIEKPKGLIKCEICAASGLLATEKCFEIAENKDTGEKIQRRTTYFELATDEQAPRVGCDVHGNVQRSFVKVIPGGTMATRRAGGRYFRAYASPDESADRDRAGRPLQFRPGRQQSCGSQSFER